MNRFAAFLAALLLAAPLSAAGLSKYKDWPTTPEAYFLSSGEREKWAAVDSDEAAEKFIAEYKAARGKGFAAALQSRIDVADKTYKTGKVKGARSPLGRTIVLMGAPSSVERTTQRTKQKSDPTGSDVVGGSAGAGKGGGGSPSNPYSNAGGPGPDTMRGIEPDKPALIQLIYKEASVPAGVGAKEVVFEFLEDPSGSVTFVDQEKSEAVFQKVIAYWAPKPK